jgi:AraC family transcriptional regulator, transcriptional activator of pobA
MTLYVLESNHKKIGLDFITDKTLTQLNSDKYKSFIKILYLAENASITIDYKKFTTATNSLFFINSNQHFQIHSVPVDSGIMLFYNRDFYCVQIHDNEVSCDGLLFNNIFEIPIVEIPASVQPFISASVDNIIEEFNGDQSSREEMIRTYLKQIIIKATRLWKQQHAGQNDLSASYDADFYRNFSRLVEVHFKEKHGLSDYAELLMVTPKTLNKKLSKLHVKNPNDIIKNRIILEAKRLLSFSTMSIKEIAYYLGYDDPAYFNRLFTNKVKATPASFRKQYQQEL